MVEDTQNDTNRTASPQEEIQDGSPIGSPALRARTPKPNAKSRVRSLTDLELEFLFDFSRSNHSWRTKLLNEWALSSRNPPASQSIRNHIGPLGLRSITWVMINEEWQARRRMKARGPQ